ncbi:nitroreductase [Chitinispirillum alkaliphilum]|nr:nitroreductase [Chitinispirillum alkaliphilum]
MSNTNEYDRLAHKIRQTPSVESNGAPDTKTLLHYGILAASSHNTQPWKVVIDANSITLRPDFDRRCPVVDPDDAHLFKSLGCAAENIVLASQAQGYIADLSMDRNGEEIRIAFEKSRSISASRLFSAIPFGGTPSRSLAEAVWVYLLYIGWLRGMGERVGERVGERCGGKVWGKGVG